MTKSHPFIHLIMLNIVIFGAPGSGKGTQSELLIKKYNLKHISTGEILREEMKNATKLGKLAGSYMQKGHLVPDSVVIDMLEEVVEKHAGTKKFIFDGFPRTLAQGEALSTMLAKHGHKIDIVINLEVEDEELIDRLLKRGQALGRADDNRNTIESRLEVYNRQTLPLKEFYREQGVLHEINGTGSIENIFGRIEVEIEKVL